jgi:hypothetical protein
MSTNPVYAVRLENLRHLIRQWDGPGNLARKLGHANASFVVQLAGPNPRRRISEKVARDIEACLKLSAGWMDEPHKDAPLQIDDTFLRECVRMVSQCVRDAHLTLDPDVVANLTSLSYEHARAVGSIDRVFVESLLELIKTKH